MAEQEMYYNRVIPQNLQVLLMPEGELHWLSSYVKKQNDLDFLIGANNSKSWIYVYRGTSKLLDIHYSRVNSVNVSAAPIYKELAKNNDLTFYGHRKLTDLDFEGDFKKLVNLVTKDSCFKKYYNNRKEGYFQNLFSRQFGIESSGNEEFVVVDKEVVIGYKNKEIKESHFGKEKKKFVELYEHLSRLNSNIYGSKLGSKPLGGEVDFLAVNKAGEILLIEFKHGSNTSGIYLAPVQLGLYHRIFQNFMDHYRDDFFSGINKMITQKKEIGLISQQWPEVDFTGKIIPVLFIAEFNEKGSAITKFSEVLNICRNYLKDDSFLSDLKVYKYNEEKKLNQLGY